MELRVNKGVGKPIEISGLQSQYLFIFAGGLVGVFFLFVILFALGINHWICIAIGIVLILMLTKLTFTLSRKYGRWGLMKIQARRSYPHFIINRKSIRKILKLK